VPNQFRIGRSAGYAALSTLLHIGAGVVAVVPFARVSALFSVLVLMLIALAWRRDLAAVASRRARDAVVLIEVCEDRWRLLRRTAPPFGPAVLEAYRGAAAGVLLVLRDGNGTRERVLVPADALSAADLRRIRVHAHAALAGTCT
jgi:hypothetical protein